MLLSLAGAGFPLVAAADVTMYGFISAAVESVKTSGATNGGNSGSAMRVTDQTSRIGFKGTEDLGDGRSAIWQVESAVKFTGGGTGLNGTTSTLASRNSFVGLADRSYGTLQMGYYESAYRRFTTMNVGTDLMVNTTAGTDVALNYQGVVNRGDARLKNSVHYTTPTWNGFQAGVSWGADENAANYGKTGSQQRLSFGGQYSDGGFIVAAGYDRQNNLAANLSTAVSSSQPLAEQFSAMANTNISFSKLAAGYKTSFGTYFGAAFEHGELGRHTASSSTMTQNDYTLAVSQAVGRATFMLSYNRLGSLENAYAGAPDDWSATQWVVGSTYALSKTTTLLAYWTRLNNSKYQNQTLIQNVYDSGAYTTSGVLLPGSTVSAIGAGLRISF
jgi:predicted porin